MSKTQRIRKTRNTDRLQNLLGGRGSHNHLVSRPGNIAPDSPPSSTCTSSPRCPADSMSMVAYQSDLRVPGRVSLLLLGRETMVMPSSVSVTGGRGRTPRYRETAFSLNKCPKKKRGEMVRWERDRSDGRKSQTCALFHIPLQLPTHPQEYLVVRPPLRGGE